MSRIVFLNGAYLPESEASVSVFDRGFLFADAVYEVTAVVDGRLVEFDAHCDRLSRSLRELRLECPRPRADLLAVHRELVARNRLREGLVYLQVSRGAADRDFAFPAKAEPTLLLFTQEKNLLDPPSARNGLRVLTLPDPRWQRRDIKTVQLLASSLARMDAQAAGKDDAWLVEDGLVTEATSSNAFIVSPDGVLVTRSLSSSILHGITRSAILEIAAALGLALEERPFPPQEARSAAEAFVTAATAFVTPVVEIDGVAIGNGKPGPVTRKLRQLYLWRVRETA